MLFIKICLMRNLTRMDYYFAWISDVTSIWHTSVRVQSSKRTSSNAPKSVRTPMKQPDRSVHPMGMCIVHCAKWKRRHVAAVWFLCHWRIVRPPLTVTRIVMPKRLHSFAVQTINFIAANARCEKRIAANTCSSYRWSAVWPHSHSKDAPECVHKTMSPYAAPTINPIQMNAF